MLASVQGLEPELVWAPELAQALEWGWVPVLALELARVQDWATVSARVLGPVQVRAWEQELASASGLATV